VSELLLELLSEEIPARMQPRAIEGLTGLLRDKLSAAQIPAESIRGYVTPRRLTVVAEGIPAAQPNRTEERRGPRLGAPQPAIDGFLRSAGLVAVTECEIRDTDRGEFYFAVVNRPGRPAREVLPELIQGAMAELPWPKSMRYPASDLRWVRPLTSVLCMLDAEVLPLPLGRVPVGRTTRGHRFLAPGEIAVDNATDFLDRLEAAYVILDQDRRRDIIAADLDRLAQSQGLGVKPDPGLLDEVTGLVEFPVVLMGTIDADFMALPREVLATAMRAHQKYFSCLRPDGTPAPRFLFVANNLTTDGGKTIIAGNERVLRARLADARFFWDQDRRIKLSSRIEALADRIFHAKLGTLHDKASRMDELADYLIPIAKADEDLAKRAIYLAKADLSTSMVGEFPELQGVMGRYYALHDGQDPRVATAIAEHYKPVGPDDICPSAPESVVVALADKIDTLAGLFAIREAPTGSRDPYALRRAALGVIRLILENDLRLRLRECLSRAAQAFQSLRSSTDVAEQLFNFVADRLHIFLRSQGYDYDIISAVFDRGSEEDLDRLVRRVRALQAFLASEDGASLLTAFRRASNIVAIEERKYGVQYAGEVDREQLHEPEEHALTDHLVEIGGRVGTLLEREEFDKAMAELAKLRRPIDDFFEKVTVNCDEPALRENRLRLLSRIRETMNRVADFSQIEG
jgi:glycyl-tRNA synthetase beta chain